MADKYINTIESSEEDKVKMKWAREVLHRLENIGEMEHFLKDEHIKAIRIAEYALDEMTNNSTKDKFQGGLKKAEYLEKKEAINALLNKGQKSRRYKLGETWELNLFEIEEAITEAPAADVQPVKRWVKLHDKHPDTEGFYLVCDQYGECEVAEYIPDIKSWFVHKINGEIRYWMPLPEVPKGGDAE